MELTRRRFVVGALASVCYSNGMIRHLVNEHDGPPNFEPDDLVHYGYILAGFSGTAEPDERAQRLGNYQGGALLRYRHTQNPGWVRVEHDSYVRHPSFELSRGEIFLKESYLREIKPFEVAPIHPDVNPDDKRIEVFPGGPDYNSSPAHYIAFEGEREIRRGRVTGGAYWPNSKPGEHRLYKKQWARHMQGFDELAGGTKRPWNLPGVPFTQYYEASQGVAIHGAYWHRRFGRPWSHGCVNAMKNDAIWLYRWTDPKHKDFQVESVVERGTRIIVHG